MYASNVNCRALVSVDKRQAFMTSGEDSLPELSLRHADGPPPGDDTVFRLLRYPLFRYRHVMSLRRTIHYYDTILFMRTPCLSEIPREQPRESLQVNAPLAYFPLFSRLKPDRHKEKLINQVRCADSLSSSVLKPLGPYGRTFAG